MTRQLHTIVIVGGGFSGLVLAANLLRRPLPHAAHILLVERCSQVGGAAYVTRSHPYLLNVPAGRMSADSLAPDAFLEYARLRSPDVSPHAFLPRSWYGDYLRAMLVAAERAAPPRIRLERVQAEVVGITRTLAGGGLKVECADGRVLSADDVVLANGNPPPALLPGLELLSGHPRYVGDACRDGSSDAIRGEVLLIGTGLTMADAALMATGAGARTLHAISRHGLVPPAQTASAHWTGAGAEAAALEGVRSVRQLLRTARRLAREAEAAGADWREVVNAIRERAPRIWHALDEAQRRQFLRHLRPYWDVHRHRLPPTTAGQLDALRSTGQLQVRAGRIVEARPDGSRLRVVWRPRGSALLRHLSVDWILNCTGPDYDLRRSVDPLFRSAIRSGLIVPDACGLGLKTGAHGALVDSSGRTSRDLYCLGPMLRGDHWETTAVAELRSHAEALAAHLADRVLDADTHREIVVGSTTLSARAAAAPSAQTPAAPVQVDERVYAQGSAAAAVRGHR